MNLRPEERLIVALDVAGFAQAEAIVDRLRPTVTFFKIGSQLFTACGPRALELVKKSGGRVFLDLKFHDIPNTVASAVAAACGLGVDIINLHAAGGFLTMEAAVKAASETCTLGPGSRPLLLGVTVLTSLDDESLVEVMGVKGLTVSQQVLHLANLSKSAGLDGVVASPQEIAMIRQHLGPEFVILTPGIRAGESSADDQKRFATPAQAIVAGADFIVVGRPITKAQDPAAAAKAIIEEIGHAVPR